MRSDNERAKGCPSGQAQNRWMEGINMNWKSFGIGFVVGVALLSGISHYRARTQNVIKTWPEDYQKSMKVIAPWLTEAKVGRIGKQSQHFCRAKPLTVLDSIDVRAYWRQ